MTETQLHKLLEEVVKQPRESEWVEFKHNFHSAEEIGQRLSALEEHNAATASRIIRDTLASGLIKDDDPTTKSRKYAKYIPFWA